MIFINDFFRDAHVLPVHQRITLLCTLIHTVVDTHSQERGHCLCGIIGLGKLRRPQIETSSEVPMLIVLKGEDIEQQLEIVHCGCAQHIHMIIDIVTREAFHHLLHLIEGTLHRVALIVIDVNPQFIVLHYGEVEDRVQRRYPVQGHVIHSVRCRVVGGRLGLGFQRDGVQTNVRQILLVIVTLTILTAIVGNPEDQVGHGPMLIASQTRHREVVLEVVHTTAVVDDVIGVAVEQLGIEVGDIGAVVSACRTELLVHVIGGTQLRTAI